MTTLNDAIDAESMATAPPRHAWFDRYDAALTRLNERLNPILVKEARQALKSRQFVITFLSLLLLSWAGSFVGVSIIGPDIHFGANGPDMFMLYYVPLAFCLCVIVPFSAFRSLAAEREDSSYELLTITTLTPRQIVTGKLGSAVLQMLVYFSAIAPCLAFTYMLRGIAFPLIAIILTYSFLISLGLAMLCLLCATVAQEKHWQVVLSVVVIAGLLLAFWLVSALCYNMLGETLPLRNVEFWIVNAGLLTLFASTFVMVLIAAASQLTFASENRSSAMRWCMLVQQILWIGWMTLFILSNEDIDALFGVMAFAWVFWYLMGMFLVSENATLSRRVLRRLPQSLLGRACLTWFNPGSGAGYVFVVANLTALSVLTIIGGAIFEDFVMVNRTWRTSQMDRLPMMVAVGLGYVTMFLGAGRLLVMFVRRFTQLGMLAAVLIQILFLVICVASPLTIHLMNVDWMDDYALIEVTNPFWTLQALANDDFLAGQQPIVFLLLSVATCVVIAANLPSIITEVARTRVAKPQRVAEEDAVIEATLHPHIEQPASPWD